jgi:hypothetical protein
VAFDTGSWISIKYTFASKGRRYENGHTPGPVARACLSIAHLVCTESKGNELPKEIGHYRSTDRDMPDRRSRVLTGTKKNGAPVLCASTFHFATS